MTRHEEILKGIARLCLRSTYPDGSFVDWDSADNHEIEQAYEEARELLSYLHSQGVMVKVDRELPVLDYDRESLNRVSRNTQRSMLEAGYEAVIPLMGGGENDKL